MTDRSHWKVRKYKLGEEPEVDEDVLRMTPAQRLDLQWEVTKNAWAFFAKSFDEPTFRRDVARVIRRQR